MTVETSPPPTLSPHDRDLAGRTAAGALGPTWENFWHAAEVSDRIGMTARVREAWQTAEADPENPLLFALAGSMREQLILANTEWDRKHKGVPTPEVVGVEESEHSTQGPHSKVNFVRLSPRLAPGENDTDLNPVEVILEGGFGTDPKSVADAGKTICMGDARSVIMVDHPKAKRKKPARHSVHPSIDPYFMERAENLLAVMEAAADGDPGKQFDLVLQSGAMQGVAAALLDISRRDDTRVSRVRSIVLDSASGLMQGEDTRPRLLGRFGADSLGKNGRKEYGQNKEQKKIYVLRLLRNIIKSGAPNALDELEGISGSRLADSLPPDGPPIESPLSKLRKRGVLVGAILAPSDGTFPVGRVHPSITSDEYDEFGNIVKYGTTDRYVWRNRKEAPHGALLFETGQLGMGAGVDVQMLQSLVRRMSLPRIFGLEPTPARPSTGAAPAGAGESSRGLGQQLLDLGVVNSEPSALETAATRIRAHVGEIFRQAYVKSLEQNGFHPKVSVTATQHERAIRAAQQAIDAYFAGQLLTEATVQAEQDNKALKEAAGVRA